MCVEETNTRNDHGNVSPLGSPQTPFISQQLLYQGDAKGNERIVAVAVQEAAFAHECQTALEGVSAYLYCAH